MKPCRVHNVQIVHSSYVMNGWFVQFFTNLPQLVIRFMSVVCVRHSFTRTKKVSGDRDNYFCLCGTICMVIFCFFFNYLFSTTIWLSTQDYLLFVSNENVEEAKQFPSEL